MIFMVQVPLQRYFRGILSYIIVSVITDVVLVH